MSEEVTRICGVSESRAAVESGCRVPQHEVRLGIDESFLERFTQAEIVKAFEEGVSLWSKYANIRVTIEMGVHETLIRPVYGRIDGPSGTVAWSHLPCPFNPPLHQRYDSTERWSLDFNPDSGISLPNVIAHEVGHALGLGHGPRNNIMTATIQNHMTDLGPWDREEIERRYGPPEDGDDGGDDMSRFFTCIIGVLPQLLQCMFQSEQEAQAAGQKGPITWLAEATKKE